ncbi:MAG: N,N-dimethylformamidase beta subunit family domain-containing protein [bacterium]
MSFLISGPYDDGDPVTGHYYEMASADPTRAQVWGYSSALSYAVGDEVVLHGMSSATTARLVIARDGLEPAVVLSRDVAMQFATTPNDCSVMGCSWPEVLRFRVPEDWVSGVYTVSLMVPGHLSEHIFVIRRRQHRMLMILATGTWCAYNDWGGSNHYQGMIGPRQTDAAHDVSMLRPWAKGFVRWPGGAPRIPHASPLLSRPRYPHMEFARARGISKKYASSGWAAFERPFALWCETQGIGLDYMTQHDLHAHGVPDGYDRVLIVGHDEYWTWEMRDHLEDWVDAGGKVARFAGNFYWQTRLSADLTTQTCWKVGADPVKGARRTTYWDAPEVGRPAVATMGLTGAMGVYAGWSRCAAHGSGGFAIYRPGHWSLRDTGLGYGDVLGVSAKIFGYEVDGVDYGMRHGLPFAEDGALRGGLEIVGLSPATTLSHHTSPADRDLFIGHLDAEDTARVIYGAVNAETMGRASRGNGCMAEYRRGKGRVFNAGSCEWVNGLIEREPTVERVTRNVLLGDWG